MSLQSAQKIPYVVGYKNLLQGKDTLQRNGYLIMLIWSWQKLDSINNYIIIDDSYGYNAVVIAPYAMLRTHLLFLADKATTGMLILSSAQRR